MYASRDDMLAQFGEAELIQLTDRQNNGAISDAVLQRALQEASAEIDTWLASRYRLPLTTPVRILTVYACDMARYRLCGSGALITDDIRDRYRDATRFLEKVASGQISLGLTTTDQPVATGNQVQFCSIPPVFARGNW